MAEETPSKMVLRLGAMVNLDDVPSLPERFRQRVTQLQGRLGSVFLLPDEGDVWCRLSRGLSGQVWPPTIKRVDARTFPLNDQQMPTPTPNVAMELHPHMHVECRDGYAGKLEGIVIDGASGVARTLLLRIRTNLQDDVASPSDPLGLLIPLQGQAVMIPPEWAKSPETVNHMLGAAHYLKLDATASQVAHGLILRNDGDLQQDVYEILGKNPALATYLSTMRVGVHDGAVTLTGAKLSPRLNAATEQDIWHVPGILALHNLMD